MPGSHSKIKIFAAFFAIFFVWGTTYLGIKYAVETIPPFLMMGMRSISAGAVLYMWGRLRGDANVTRKQLPPLIFIGSLFFLVGHGGLAWAQKTVPSGVASLLVATEPLIISVFEPVITLGNRIGRRTILGMLTGMAGIAFLVLPKGFNFENANLTGTLVILLCASSWSIGAIYSRIANIPRSPFITGGMQLISGGVLLILMSFILNEWSGFSFQQVTARSWSGLAYLVFFGSIITFSAYTWLLSITTATRISTHNFINPVIAVIVGWAFGNEALTSEILVATALIIVAVWLVLYRKK